MLPSPLVNVHHLLPNGVVCLQTFHGTSQCITGTQILQHRSSRTQPLPEERGVSVDDISPLSAFMIGVFEELASLRPGIPNLFAGDPHLIYTEIYSNAATIGAAALPMENSVCPVS